MENYTIKVTTTHTTIQKVYAESKEDAIKNAEWQHDPCLAKQESISSEFLEEKYVKKND